MCSVHSDHVLLYNLLKTEGKVLVIELSRVQVNAFNTAVNVLKYLFTNHVVYVHTFRCSRCVKQFFVCLKSLM